MHVFFIIKLHTKALILLKFNFIKAERSRYLDIDSGHPWPKLFRECAVHK